MGPQKIEHYTLPHQFEPLLPGAHRMGPLLERASDLTRVAARLAMPAGQLPMRQLAELLRRMNSYYTNRLEGEHTRPSEIERALQEDYSRNADLARRQRLAVAHIRSELACESLLAELVEYPDVLASTMYSADALKWIHFELFSGLSDPDLALANGTLMAPGDFRQRQVAVGRHEAPLFRAIPEFVARWGEFYGKSPRGEAAIVAAAASHHRLAWIHPFPDGNGRVTRLHTHLLMQTMGYTHGLWSPLRGFAGSEDRYRGLLAAADEHRHGDLDGRGNLTEQGLVDWIDYVLSVFVDQATFMSTQLDVRSMGQRIAAALTFESEVLKSAIRLDALEPLHYLFSTGLSLQRGRFKAMTGLGDRTATSLLSALVDRGFLASDTPYGEVRFAIPDHALRFYFPALWPEAEQEQAALAPRDQR
jgi:Fic family protein